MPIRVNIWKRLVGIAVVAALSGWSQHALSAAPPELGVTWTFDCGPDSPWNDRYTFTPKAVEDDVLLMEWTAGNRTGRLSTPVSALWTGFHTEKVLGHKATKQVIESGSLSFATLEVGEEVTALVRQFDSKWGRNRWQWSAKITDRITVETAAFGTLDALVIEKSRFSREWGYGSRKLTHFSPELNFLIYWKYSDTDNNVEECRLVSRDPARQPPGAARKAGGGPGEPPVQTARLTPSDQPPVKSGDEVEAYLDRNAWDIRHKLEAYNKKHRVLVGRNNILSVKKVHSTKVMDLQGDSVLLEIHFQVGRRGAQWTAGEDTFLFELKWIEDDLEFVGHGNPPAPAAGLATTDEPPVKSRDEVEAYLNKNELEIRRKLDIYNKQHRVLVGSNNILDVKKVHVTRIKDLHGDSVLLEIDFQVGRPGTGTQWTMGAGTFVFELKWIEGELEFVAHGAG